MIIGKRIGEVSVKVNVPAKNSQKQVGVPLGKFYLPEKIRFEHTKETQPCENEEDIEGNEANHKIECDKMEEKPQVINQKTLGLKNSQKVVGGHLKNQKNQVKQIQQTKNKSLQKYMTKKQNKTLSSFSKKEIKTSVHHREETHKKGIRQVSKAITGSSQTHPKTVISSLKDKLENKENKVEKKEEKQEKIQVNESEEEDSGEVEEIRDYLPDPIKNQFSLDQPEFTEISFRNNDFQVKEPTYTVQDPSSQEQDSSEQQEERETDELQPIRCITEPEQNEQLSHLSLEINEELFSLSAQELLAKEYFNI